MDSTTLITMFGAFLAIMNPFVVLPVFLAMTDGYEASQQRALVLRIAVYSLTLCASIILTGNGIITFFGVSVDAFRKFGAAGVGFWYVAEMQVRGQYYQRLTADMPNVDFVNVDLSEIVKPDGARALLTRIIGAEPDELKMPPKTNAQTKNFFPDTELEKFKKLGETLKWDAPALAKGYFESGRRLAQPPWVKYQGTGKGE